MKYIVSGNVLIGLTENRVTVLFLPTPLGQRCEKADVKFNQIRPSPQPSSLGFKGFICYKGRNWLILGKKLVYKVYSSSKVLFMTNEILCQERQVNK